MQQPHALDAGPAGSAGGSPGSSPLLTTQQVQQRLNVDASTLYRMAADGRLPAVKVGRQWRFPLDSVDALLAGGFSPSTARPEDATVQAVLDVSANLLGVMMVATDMAGRPVSDVANPCPWFVEHAEDEAVVTACTTEWRAMADDLDFAPRFQAGHLGFECARVFLRSGSELVGMVLAGGVAPEGSTASGLHHLDADQRRSVLDALPKVSAVLSRSALPSRPGLDLSAATADPTRRSA
jgi:excisionase family DNA binding protein